MPFLLGARATTLTVPCGEIDVTTALLYNWPSRGSASGWLTVPELPLPTIPAKHHACHTALTRAAARAAYHRGRQGWVREVGPIPLGRSKADSSALPGANWTPWPQRRARPVEPGWPGSTAARSPRRSRRPCRRCHVAGRSRAIRLRRPGRDQAGGAGPRRDPPAPDERCARDRRGQCSAGPSNRGL